MQNVSKTWGLKDLVFLVATTDDTEDITPYLFIHYISMGYPIETQWINFLCHSIHTMEICFENLRNKN